MKEVLMYVGLNDKDSKVQEVSTDKAKEIITSIVGDNTMQVVQGTYTHEDGTQVNETTLKVELFRDSADRLRVECEDIKRLLNQESIFCKVTDIEGLFI